MRIKEQRKRKKRRRIGICIFLVVLMLFALAALIVVKVFTVQNVVVEGNSLYSARPRSKIWCWTMIIRGTVCM